MAYNLYFIKSPHNIYKSYLFSLMKDLLNEYRINLDIKILYPDINTEFKDLYNIVLWDNFVLFDIIVSFVGLLIIGFVTVEVKVSSNKILFRHKIS